MTFTQFLIYPQRHQPKPSFLPLVRHDPLWPSQSNRLEDFEAFLHSRIEEKAHETVAELREAWRAYARSEVGAKHDLDLAVGAWGDYARHLRTCTGTAVSPCEVAEGLLDTALEESRFDDADEAARPAIPCEAEADEDDDEDDDVESRDRGDWAGWDDEAEDEHDREEDEHDDPADLR